MPAENVIERAFSGGEIAPALYARVDINKYQTGLRTLRNHICMRYGGITQRPGTMYVGTTLNGGNPVRLIPFIYNETGLGQSYMLEFGNGYIAFYQNGAVVVSAPNTPYTITSPYLQSDIQNLQFDQCADVVTITHPNYAPRELRRLAPTNWTLTALTYWGSARPGPTGVTATGTPGTPTPYDAYFVTSIGADGSESDNSAGSLFGSVFNAALAEASTTTPITLSWTAAPGAVSYRIYKMYVTTEIGAPGFIGETINTNYVDNGSLPDFTNAPPIYNQVFGGDGSGLCPTTVAYIQQRRGFANTLSNPIGFWLSQSGLFTNFDTHLTGLDSDSIFGSIAGGEVNAIQHLTELKFMLMLTAGAEIYVQGNGSGVVTPSAINAATQSQYGASPLRPLKVGDVLLFNQALGSFIRDFVFDFVIDGYRGNDITVFSSHLFEGHQIVDWAYQKVPDSIIWAVREDGVLLSCTYIKEQQILAWARHDFTNFPLNSDDNPAIVENVCAIPENGEYAVYLSIKRVISGVTHRYIERMGSRIWQGPEATVSVGMANAIGDPIESAFCDSYLQFDGRNTITAGQSMTLGSPGLITIVAGINDGISWSDSNYGFGITRLEIIPPGSYTIAQIAALVQTAFSVGSPGTGFVVNVTGGKIYIQVPGGITFKLNFQSGSPNFSRTASVTLGFDPTITYPAENIRTAANQPIFDSFQTNSSAYQQLLGLISNLPYFGTVAQVGDSIFLEDAEWVSSQGISGNQIRCNIQSIISSTVALVTPNKIVPTEFQNIATQRWARAVQTLSGLNHLIGQQVSVWADRYVIGSPLNKAYTVYTVSNTGTLTLDRPYSVIYVGLPMTADFETLQIDTSFGDSTQGERKAISNLTVYLYNSRGFFGGTQNPDFDPDNLVNGVVQDPLFNLVEEKQQGNRQTYDAPPSLMTEWQETNINVNWSKEGRIFIRNVDPIPLSILSVIPAGLTSAKVAWAQKV